VLFANKQAVEKVNNQVFIDFLSENAFEADIGEGVNEFCHIANGVMCCFSQK